MVGDTNLVIPNILAILSSLVFSPMGSREDSRHPLIPLIANFYRVILTTTMVVNTGSTSPSLVHLFTVREILIRVPNRWCKCGHEPSPHPQDFVASSHGALAENQVVFVLFSLFNKTHCKCWVMINSVNVCVTSYRGCS